MAKSKTHNEVEFLRGLVRNLKSENRSLKRRLRQLERREHMYEDIEENDSNEPIMPIAATCPGCGKGIIKEVDLGIKILYRCSIQGCDFRTVKTK